MANTYGLTAKALQDMSIVSAALAKAEHGTFSGGGASPVVNEAEVMAARQAYATTAQMYGLGSASKLGATLAGDYGIKLQAQNFTNAAYLPAQQHNDFITDSTNLYMGGFLAAAQAKQALQVPAVQTPEQLATAVAKELAALGPVTPESNVTTTATAAQKEENRSAAVRKDELAQLRLRGISRHFAGLHMTAVTPVTAFEAPKLEGN